MKNLQEYFNKTINDCVLNDDPECDFSEGVFREHQLTYFCGNHYICRKVLQHSYRHDFFLAEA